MRILVNQTTRMGDMIQTAPLIRQLRAMHPDAHIAALVRGMSRVVAERHPDINEVIVYDENPMFLDMRSGDSDRLLAAYEKADHYIHLLREGKFDIVYNLTHSISSAMLARLAEIPRVAGADLSEDWQFVLRGAWPNYFFTSVFSRDYNDLNLCDIARGFAPEAPHCHEMPFALSEEDHAQVKALLADHGIAEDVPYVCMQLGASELSKRWAEERFVELARALREEFSVQILLLGVDSEAPLGERFEQLAPGLGIRLFGKTSLPQLAALLSRAKLLVTNDTGTMHLAAAVKCPIVLVSIGHVHFRETGPWGAGHCAIEVRRAAMGRSDFVPGSADDRERISAAHALRAARFIVGGATREYIPDDDSLAGVELHYTDFAPDGCLQFYPAIRRSMAERDFIRTAYRCMWIEHLNNRTNEGAEAESLTRLLTHYDGPPSDTIEAWSNTLETAFADLARISRRGIAATEELLDVLKHGGRMTKAQQLAAHLTAIDEEARVFAEVHPACKPLILMARFERDNLEGADAVHLAQSTRGIYSACATRAELMRTKAARVLDAFKATR